VCIYICVYIYIIHTFIGLTHKTNPFMNSQRTPSHADFGAATHPGVGGGTHRRRATFDRCQVRGWSCMWLFVVLFVSCICVCDLVFFDRKLPQVRLQVSPKLFIHGLTLNPAACALYAASQNEPLFELKQNSPRDINQTFSPPVQVHLLRRLQKELTGRVRSLRFFEAVRSVQCGKVYIDIHMHT